MTFIVIRVRSTLFCILFIKAHKKSEKHENDCLFDFQRHPYIYELIFVLTITLQAPRMGEPQNYR